MDAVRGRPSWHIANLDSPLRTVISVCAVAMLCYLAGELGHALIIPPDHTTAFWPATPLLVAVLLLVPRRIWPGLIAAGFGAMVVSDLQNGVPLSSLIWFTLGDAVGVLIAALGVSLLFNGTPHFDTAKVLAKYFLFVVILAFVSALVGANAPERGSTYWLQTKLWFLSNSIAYLTVTPAALSWVGGRPWARKARGYYLEAAALILALTVFGYLAFATPGGSTPPVLLYLPVPFLLWAALRFGSFGVANSVVVIALLSIWGVAHGRGPFTEPTPLNNVLSLQLFLLFTAASSMFLAVFVEERKRAEEKLRESEERLRLAAGAGKMFAFDWDAVTDVIVRSGESGRILDIDEATSGQQVWAQVHPDDREKLTAAMAVLSADNPQFQVSHRMVRPDGTVIWVERNCRAHFDKQGKLRRIVGMVADVTERKRTEVALRESEERLRMAAQAGRMYAFEWDPTTDLILRSRECADIFFWLDNPTRDTSQDFVARLHPDDREAYKCKEVGITPENPGYRTSYRALRPDGTAIWLEASGHAIFDSQGRILRIIGMVTDVTERKLGEAAFTTLSRRLIVAQEQERFRIARELHDDLGQRLALLRIGLEEFEQNTTGLSSEAREKLHNIAEVASEVCSNIDDVSHQLHPSQLDILGLLPSLRGFCREFSEQHHLKVQFVHHDIPRQIPKDVTLCLFRIAQEGLRNIVKHSGATEAKVELSGQDGGINLGISDSGTGFNPESVEGEAGLGLISMRERLGLVGGHLIVESEPSHGTRIRVLVPLPATDAQFTSEGKVRGAGA
jgi:PAS domain S-box-containing protein